MDDGESVFQTSVESAAEHVFDAATRVGLTDRGFTTSLTPDWRGAGAPHGGVLAAIMLRAMLARAGETPFSVQSLHVHFLRQPKFETARVTVEAGRRGRRTAQLSARLLQDERACVEASMALVADEATPSRAPSPPQVASFDRAPDLFDNNQMSDDKVRWPDYTRYFQWRPAIGDSPFSGGPLATGGWLQPRNPRRLDPVLLAFMTDAWFPAAFVAFDRPVQVPTLDLTIHYHRSLRAALHPQPALLSFTGTLAGHGTYLEDGCIWSQTGELLVSSRQSALLIPGDAVL